MTNRLAKVTVTPDLFTPQECQKIIDHGTQVGWTPGPSYVAGDYTPRDDPDSRVCYSVTLDPNDLPWVWDRVRAQIKENNKYYRYNLNGPLTLYLLRYPTGGHIKEHGDALHENTETRKLTLSVQLSDPSTYGGGQLAISGGSVSVGPTDQGLCVMFPAFMLHKVVPVLTGERYSLIGWIEGKQAFR